MDDYISRQMAIKAVGYYCNHSGDKLLFADNALEAIPPADVRPVVRLSVQGYEGRYFVDNMGFVYSEKTGEKLKQQTNDKGYKTVSLYKDGSYKTHRVHRLVAAAFIPNPDGLPFVNHKDEDKTNNFVENLEWCTLEYNTNYGTARERQREKLIGRKHTKGHNKKISDSLYKYYDNGFVGRRVRCVETCIVYDSVAKASRDLNISEATIRMSCNRGTIKGRKYTFEDVEDCPNCGAYLGE